MARSGITKPQLRKEGGLTIEGLDTILDNLANVIDKTSAENLKELFVQAGTVVRDRAKANAPIRTGNLRSSIFVAEGQPYKADALVGVSNKKAPYGRMLEYGTSKMSPRPFFRSAVDASKPQVASIIITGVRKTIEDAVK